MRRTLKLSLLLLASLLGGTIGVMTQVSPVYAEKCQEKACDTDDGTCFSTDAQANCTRANGTCSSKTCS